MQRTRTSDDLAKSIYHLKDANPDYADSAIARIFSISESTLRGILKRRIGQKKSNWVKNLYSQEESSVSFRAALIETQNSGFLTFCLRPDDLSPMPRHTVFRKIATFEIVLQYKTFLRMLKKIGELIGAVDIHFLTSQKVFSATINYELFETIYR